MNKAENYLKFCSEQNLINIKPFENINIPNISIITPIYNKETTLIRYLKSIQNQSFEDIEIILIDDKSTDKSLKIIEKGKKLDKRIILIKNKERKGTLITKNLGVFISKGEYLLFVDPDDILTENILIYLYSIAKNNNFDLIRFNIYTGNGGLNLPEISYYLESKKIQKPYLYFYLFYGFGKLFQLDFYLTNKLIKRNLFISALNSINKYYLRQFMIDCEDGLVNFMLYKLSNSFFFTKKIGYYYIVTNQSITYNKGNFIKRLRSNFLYLKYLFENTKNNNIEKKMVIFVFSDIFGNHPDMINIFSRLSHDYKFYINSINKYLKSEFIPLKTKKVLKKIMISIQKKI
jgi:glycosyltransferase involved in cell wall biosynthesis